MEGYIKTLQNSQNKPPTSTEPEKSLNPEKISRKSSSSFLRSPSQMMKVEILFSALFTWQKSKSFTELPTQEGATDQKYIKDAKKPSGISVADLLGPPEQGDHPPNTPHEVAVPLSTLHIRGK